MLQVKRRYTTIKSPDMRKDIKQNFEILARAESLEFHSLTQEANPVLEDTVTRTLQAIRRDTTVSSPAIDIDTTAKIAIFSSK
jgi:hypothetical protein